MNVRTNVNRDRCEVIRDLIHQGFSQKEMADSLGISVSAIGTFLDRNGFSRKDINEKVVFIERLKREWEQAQTLEDKLEREKSYHAAVASRNPRSIGFANSRKVIDVYVRARELNITLSHNEIAQEIPTISAGSVRRTIINAGLETNQTHTTIKDARSKFLRSLSQNADPDLLSQDKATMYARRATTDFRSIPFQNARKVFEVYLTALEDGETLSYRQLHARTNVCSEETIRRLFSRSGIEEDFSRQVDESSPAYQYACKTVGKRGSTPIDVALAVFEHYFTALENGVVLSNPDLGELASVSAETVRRLFKKAGLKKKSAPPIKKGAKPASKQGKYKANAAQAEPIGEREDDSIIQLTAFEQRLLDNYIRLDESDSGGFRRSQERLAMQLSQPEHWLAWYADPRDPYDSNRVINQVFDELLTTEGEINYTPLDYEYIIQTHNGFSKEGVGQLAKKLLQAARVVMEKDLDKVIEDNEFICVTTKAFSVAAATTTELLTEILDDMEEEKLVKRVFKAQDSANDTYLVPTGVVEYFTENPSQGKQLTPQALQKVKTITNEGLATIVAKHQGNKDVSKTLDKMLRKMNAGCDYALGSTQVYVLTTNTINAINAAIGSHFELSDFYTSDELEAVPQQVTEKRKIRTKLLSKKNKIVRNVYEVFKQKHHDRKVRLSDALSRDRYEFVDMFFEELRRELRYEVEETTAQAYVRNEIETRTVGQLDQENIAYALELVLFDAMPMYQGTSRYFNQHQLETALEANISAYNQTGEWGTLQYTEQSQSIANQEEDNSQYSSNDDSNRDKNQTLDEIADLQNEPQESWRDVIYLDDYRDNKDQFGGDIYDNPDVEFVDVYSMEM